MLNFVVPAAPLALFRASESLAICSSMGASPTPSLPRDESPACTPSVVRVSFSASAESLLMA